MKNRFTEEQIIKVLQDEAGRAVKNILREHGIRQDTYYRWKRKYGGVELATLEMVECLDYRRLLEPLAHVHPADFESMHYPRQQSQSRVGGLN